MYIHTIGNGLKKNKIINNNLSTVVSIFQYSDNPKQTPPNQSDSFFLTNFFIYELYAQIYEIVLKYKKLYIVNMKHLKLFENSSDVVKVVIVDFTGGGDGVHACYVDGILELYGDYYHDKIQDTINGFVIGLKWFKKNYVYPINIEVERFTCNNEQMIEDISEYGNTPPKNLKDVSYLTINTL